MYDWGWNCLATVTDACSAMPFQAMMVAVPEEGGAAPALPACPASASARAKTNGKRRETMRFTNMLFSFVEQPGALTKPLASPSLAG